MHEAMYQSIHYIEYQFDQAIVCLFVNNNVESGASFTVLKDQFNTILKFSRLEELPLIMISFSNQNGEIIHVHLSAFVTV